MYLIDGHNLIGQLDDLSLADPNDEAKLVIKLNGFAARVKKKCVVVFDQGLPGGKSRMSTSSVEVVFAPSRTTADRVMMERIGAANNADQWVVVSNDNEVLNAARQRKMRALKSREFVPLLKPAPVPKRERDKDARGAGEVYPSAAEVEAWLKLFNEKK